VSPPNTPSSHGALYLVKDSQATPQRYDEMQVGMSSGFNSLTNAITIEYWMKPMRADGNYYNPVYKAEPGSSWPVYGLGWARDGKPNAQILNSSGTQFQLWGGGSVMTNDTWVHVAMTYDASVTADNFRLYQNGQLVKQGTASGSLKTGTAPLHIGGSYCEWQQGVSMEELRFWSRALSAAEIQSVMNKSLTGSESGLVAYYSFDSTTKDLTGHGNEGVLVGKESFVEGRTPPTTITRKDFIGTWAGSGIYYRNSETGAWVYLASAASRVAAGDMDGDGIDELIGNWPGSGIWVKYSSTGQWAALSSPASWIAMGDLNGDKKSDLIGIWDGVIYALDSATGAWISLSSGASQVAAGDMDGDGKADLVGNWSSGLWVRYSTTGQWSLLTTPADWIAMGDLSGDGKADCLGIWGSTIWARDSASGAWSSLSSGASQVAAGDLDGDGKDDLIGIWSSDVWAKYSSSGSWERISSAPSSMTVGRMR
jgi:hypothetical protein